MAVLIEMSTKRDKTLSVYIKTCKEWEAFIKAKSTGESDGSLLFGNISGKYYKMRDISELNALGTKNDFSYPLISDGRFNSALFRLKGLSEGITIEVPQLVTTRTIVDAMETLKKAFKEYFVDNVKPVEVKFVMTTAEL
jgi:hypothetical protein